MVRFILMILLIIYGSSYSSHRYYKLYKKDGSIEIVDITKTKLSTLKTDKNNIYIEPPRRLKLMLDVASNSSVGVSGSSNTTFTIKTYKNQVLKILPYPSELNLSVSGSCNQTADHYQCSDGILTINVNASSDWRVILSSNSHIIKTSDISVPSYYIGTNAKISNKTGKNVLVGVIDTGIDFCHPMFKKSDGSSRIIYYYEPSTNTEFNQSQINQKIKNGDCNYDYDGHGTHVAGIAAGYDSSSIYTGIAKDSDLIVVRTDLTDSDVIMGLNYLKQKKDQLNRPMVVNMSLGFHFGPHDGSSLLEKTIQTLSSPGFIVVASAGNEGDRPMHAKLSDISSESVVSVRSETGDLIDGWYKGGKLKVKVCKDASCISADPSATAYGNIGGCNVYIDNTTLSSPLNSDGEFIVEFDCVGDLTLSLTPISKVLAADLYFADPFGESEFLNYVDKDAYGGYLGTVAMPATSAYVIGVGAITSKPSAFVTSKSFIDLGKIAFFSSRGPTRDGRVKPDITAPGYFVVSALSGTSGYIQKAGTSMSSPVVTGIIALILEDNPNLDVFQIKDILKNNALSDMYTQNLPNNTYGYGKISGLIASIFSGSGGNATPSDGGGGGCSLQKPMDLAIIFIPILLIITLRIYQRRYVC